MFRSSLTLASAWRRPRRGGARGGRLRGSPLSTCASAAVVAVLVVAWLGVYAAARPAGAAPTYQPLRLVFDSSVASATGNEGCSDAFGAVGESICWGSFLDEGSTAPFVGAAGSAVSRRAEVGGDISVTFTLPEGELSGTVDDDAPDELHVSSGLASWSEGLRTPADTNVAAGAPGGPLALAIVDGCAAPDDGCHTRFEVSGYVLAAQAPALPPGSGEEDWRRLEVYVDADTAFGHLTRGCRGHYFHGEVYPVPVGGYDEKFTCNGEFKGQHGTVQTTWPFDHDRGTVQGGGRNFATTSCCVEGYMDFLVPGAKLSGRVEQEWRDGYVKFVPHRYDLTELHVDAWAPNGGRAGNEPVFAAGMKGGPMYMEAVTDFRSWESHEQTAWTFWLSGWVRVNPPNGVTAPSPSTTSAPPAPSSTLAPNPTNAAVPVAVRPQFTG
jgi:hypothetical protein